MSRGAKGQELAGELEEVDNLSRDDLVQHWQQYYGCLPPKGVKRQLLERAFVHHLQERRYGKLKPAIRKKLLNLIGISSEALLNPVSVPSLSEGNRLVRDWQGKTYIVDVLEDGFRWKEKTYKSLSAIATEITGTRWSGPRFFGL
jgi:hypothetical protein